MQRRHWLLIIIAAVCCSKATAQQFFNLSAEELKIDSLLPCFNYVKELGPDYAKYAYDVAIEYPEFVDMTPAEVARYRELSSDELPPLPVVEQHIGVIKKQGSLYLSFVPLVMRDGLYQKLVSFKLAVKERGANAAVRSNTANGTTDADEDSERYAAHSVLAEGRWVKIRIPETGIYHITPELVREAGFSDIKKVKIYGYGGAMQPEKLLANYLTTTDDLHEIATCTIGGRRLFWGVGPVNWDSPTNPARIRNPYSEYGYYFLTEDGSDEKPLTLDSIKFAKSFYPSANDYHALHEIDDFSWYHGGRNLYEQSPLGIGATNTYTLPAYSERGVLTVAMSYENYCDAEVFVNDSLVGNTLIDASTASKSNKRLKAFPDDYSKAAVDSWSFQILGGLRDENTITIRQTSGATMRLDYITLSSLKPRPMPSLSKTEFPVPEVVGSIQNQDLHSHGPADLVIIIPANKNFYSEAERMKELHETCDNMRVSIVAADQLFNEFSCGTPDANAYRRYMKMLYDRAESTEDQPRYLLLFGDGAWDNRMLTTNWRTLSPDDYLLCYESDNSFSETKCYVSDDYFCLLDDGEGTDMVTDKIDAAAGRFPASSEEEAKIIVDKVYRYRLNENAGDWQNTLCFMGDDGDKNRHMDDAEQACNVVEQNYPGYNIKKIYWDSYTQQPTANGDTYPEVTNLIRQQMQEGALVMNYSGHGNTHTLSHETAFTLDDMMAKTTMRLPLWVTASCDIMPFDGREENFGEAAIFNKDGGAIAFFGTTRTVYAAWNRPLNMSFMRHVLGKTDGRRTTIGEAAFMAKNEFTVGTSRDMIVNKQQFTLLGDPALALAAPAHQAVIDDIGGNAVDGSNLIRLEAGSKVSVNGHIDGASDFDGDIAFTIRDVEETIVCRKNKSANADTAMVYKTRPNTIFVGNGTVKGGQFSFTFTIPKDISYSDDPCQLLIYAISNDRKESAHGENDAFAMVGGDDLPSDGVGPTIYCYLDNESVTDGGVVGPSPLFYAMLHDDDGLNVSGNGIGHDLELVIDGRTVSTYTLNNYFEYSVGDYTTGTVSFTIPEMNAGRHHLLLRAWDVLNNSSTAELDFEVADQMTAGIFDIQQVTRHDTYDLQGRRVSNSSHHSPLLIIRDNNGKVRKMAVGGR